jgi:Co/Zn/Cd efflux system component
VTAAAAHLDPRYRTALVASAALNVAMFFAEGTVGLWIGSAALIADAVDFLEDFGVYTLAVVALGWGVRSRAAAGLVMGLAMLGVGLVAAWQVIDRLLFGGAPPPGSWPGRRQPGRTSRRGPSSAPSTCGPRPR